MKHWAIIGNGFIADRHKKAIRDVGDYLIATCDIDPEKNADYESLEDLIESEDFAVVENVAVCTPNDSHVLIAQECAIRDKKVLVEKPLGLSSKEIELLPNDGSVMCVLQLRHHPAIRVLKDKGAKSVVLDVAVPRGNSYWSSWKGDEKRSGGILMNIGIHYLDMLVYLYGNEYEVNPQVHTNTEAYGYVRFKNGPDAKYHIQIIPDGEKGHRDLVIDGTKIELSNSDNLSYDDLHKDVYTDFKEGNGILPNEAIKAVQLAEKL